MPAVAEDSLVLDRVAARRFAEVRRTLNLSQSDVAKAAERLGLDWSRSVVHAIERFGVVYDRVGGTRRLTLTELFEYPKVLKKACEMRKVPYAKVHPAWFLMDEQQQQVEVGADA